MKKVTKLDFKIKETTELLQKRSLDEDFPELKPYLKPGIKVLDVGCGPGSVTRGVAEYVSPGEVTGVDAVGEWIDTANDLAAKQKLTNLCYRHMDAHDLDFPDDCFDVTYSRQAMQYFIDPVRCLKEQKRVTKEGGWIYAKVADLGIRLIHPPCPAFDKIMDARARYADYLAENYKPGDHISGFYLNPCSGRRCVEWFTKAGLTIEMMEILPPEIVRPGTESHDSRALAKQFRLNGLRQEHYRAMIEAGFVKEEDFERARKAMDSWYDEPYGFLFQGALRVAARV
jgi:ubiquinone/menaquinone biosynthesis C-methylase UbiE